jgi:hypothetical protein
MNYGASEEETVGNNNTCVQSRRSSIGFRYGEEGPKENWEERKGKFFRKKEKPIYSGNSLSKDRYQSMIEVSDV